MKRPVDTDPEDDEDYVPPSNDHGGSSSDSEDGSDVEGANIRSTAQPEEREKKDLSKVWQDFQASVSGKPTATAPHDNKLVKVVRKYRFAGEEHEEVVEAPEDSTDAKKWARHKSPAVDMTPMDSLSRTDAANETAKASVIPVASSKTVSSPIPDAHPTTSSSSASAKTSTPQTVPPKRKPGPRKPKTTLAPFPSAASKAKKITTLEKSAMDWSKHVTPGDKDELEARRRGGGGYLDKVEFLNRVEERKESMLSENSSSKRRRL